jgi:hypothetical protein
MHPGRTGLIKVLFKELLWPAIGRGAVALDDSQLGAADFAGDGFG